MAYVPERGDIVRLEFDPASGQEMKGPHYGLVLSGKIFNRRGLAMVCPISQGAADVSRTHGTIVTLMGSGTDTQGAIHCHEMKALDWHVRKAKYKESVPPYVIDEVFARVEAILAG
jgi:mRNA interferase ChpB